MRAIRSATVFLLAIAATAPGQGTTAPTPPSVLQFDLQAEFARNLPAKNRALNDIRERLIARPPNVAVEAKDPAKVKLFIDRLRADGQFDDVPPPPESWKTGLRRLNAVAAAFVRMPVDEQTALRKKLFDGIEFYARQAVEKPDSFANAAFLAPRDAASIYFTLYPQLQTPEAKSTLDALRGCIELTWYFPMNGDSSRKNDPDRLEVFTNSPYFIVGNFTYRSVVECAVVTGSTRRMDVVAAMTKLSLANVTSWQTADDALWGDVGLQQDGNAMAHGRQSYLFGYNKDWLYGAAGIAEKLKGTPWQIPGDRWDRAADMLLDGMQWYAYKNDADWSVAGRHNVYPGPIGDADKVLRGAAKRLLDAASGLLKREAEVKALDERIKEKREFAGNRWFWSAEDMIHRRDDYYLSTNLTSVRSNGPEVAGPASVVNYHFPFGTMCIKTHGDEYQRARGALNYAALPGLTADPSRRPPDKDNWDGYHGNNTFCGGVSDGRVGVCGFVLDDSVYRVAGHKSYFFFDGGCVALGAGLTTGKTETTINQTEWRGLAAYDGGPTNLPAGGIETEIAVDKPKWFLNDGTGYVVMPFKAATRVKLSAAARPTRWPELAKTNTGKPGAEASTVPVFQLSIPHPANQDSYAYAVLPHASEQSLRQAVAKLPFTILANSTTVQAVKFDENTVQAVFFSAGAIDTGDVKLSVDRPAVVMLRPVPGGGWTMHVADPQQTVPAGIVRVTVTPPGDIRHRTLRCTLPEKPLIGKAALFSLEK